MKKITGYTVRIVRNLTQAYSADCEKPYTSLHVRT